MLEVIGMIALVVSYIYAIVIVPTRAKARTEKLKVIVDAQTLLITEMAQGIKDLTYDVENILGSAEDEPQSIR